MTSFWDNVQKPKSLILDPLDTQIKILFKIPAMSHFYFSDP